MYKNTNTAVFVPFMLADRYSGVSRTCIIFNINLLNCLGIQVHNLVAKSQWHCNIIFSLLCDIFWVNLLSFYLGKWGINAGFLRYNLIKRLFISLVHNSVRGKIRNLLVFFRQTWGSCLNRYNLDKEISNIWRSKSSGRVVCKNKLTTWMICIPLTCFCFYIFEL